MHFKVYSSYDGWEIQALDGDGDLKWLYSWSQDEYEFGVGGENLFADILKALGYSVYEEEVY